MLVAMSEKTPTAEEQALLDEIEERYGELPLNGQKNLTLGKALRKVFESWCGRRGYDNRLVLLASWITFAEMGHEERSRAFDIVRRGEREIIKTIEEIERKQTEGGAPGDHVTTSDTAGAGAAKKRRGKKKSA